MCRTAVALVAGAACAGAAPRPHCAPIASSLQDYERPCPTSPYDTADSCTFFVEKGAAVPPMQTTCDQWCDQHGSDCVTGVDDLAGACTYDDNANFGCGVPKGALNCVCRPRPQTAYCALVQNQLNLPKPYFMARNCASVPTGSVQAPNSCVIKVNGGQPQHSTSCKDLCENHDATCVDSSLATQGKTCYDPWQSVGCNVESRTLTCVCRDFTGITPSPTSTTPSPSSSTPSPTSTTPSPTSSTPSPTAQTTSSPTSSTPSPSSSTPSPTSSTPSPSSSTPSPTSSTPSPSSSTPSPTSTTPSPTSSTPSPTSTTPSPTSSTPAPTQESVSGDPFTTFGGKKTQFYLPAQKVTPLLACGGLELLGRARASGVPGDDQQWFDKFELRVGGEEVLSVTVRNTTRLLPTDASAARAWREAQEDGVDLDVPEDTAAAVAAAALARLRAAEAAAGPRALTTLDVVAQEGRMSVTGSVLTADGKMNVTVVQDGSRHIGTGYVEVVEVETADISMHMESSVAGKFASTADRIKSAHIDIGFTKLSSMPCLSGLLPEIWGVKPMSSSTARALIPLSKNAKPGAK